MNNARFEELMERKLGDGLSVAESRELEGIIARDPGLREEHDLLVRTGRLLSALTPVEPPADLQRSIMRQVMTARAPQGRPQRSSAASVVAAIRSAFDFHRRPVLKLGFAAGCVAAAALVLTVVNRPVEPVHVSGSMVPEVRDLVVTDQIDIVESGATGTARVEVDSEVVVLTLDLLSPDDLAVTIIYSEADLSVQEVAASDGAAVTMVNGPGQIRLGHQGSRQITLIFNDLSPEEPSLSIQVGSGSPVSLATGRSDR